MKTFRNRSGFITAKTMTVGELRESLSGYPADMPVLAEWEGTQNAIHPNHIEVQETDFGEIADRCECLIFDVEYSHLGR